MMDSGLLSLKWNNHGSTFFHVLSSIRKKESYTDVTITCGGKFYPVHKLVLSTCSEYFEEIFERTQCKHPVIVLKDIKHEELEALLNYMYLGEVNVLQAELAGLINAAECLKIKGLAVPDEAPLIKSDSSRENKRSAKDSSSSNSGPHHKRSRHEEEIRLSPSNSSQSFRSHHKESSREPRTSSTQSAAEPGFTSPSYRSPNQTSEGTRERRAAAEAERLNDSYSKKGNSTSNSSHPIHPIHPIEEVIVEDTPTVKEEIEEPKEEEEEEVINSDSSLAYDTLAGTGMGNDGDGPNMFKQHMSAGPQDIEDLVAQSLPGPSSQQGESLMGWAGGGGANSGGFSLEGFPLEDSSQGGPAGATQGGQQMEMGGDGSTVPRRHSVSSSAHLTSLSFPREQRRDNHHSITYSSHVPFNLPQPLVGQQKGISNSRGSHICQFCNRRFILSSDLTRHIRIHTGEKPFLCPFCDHRTARKFSLDKHIFNMHTAKNTQSDLIEGIVMLSSSNSDSVTVNEYSSRDTDQDDFTNS